MGKRKSKQAVKEFEVKIINGEEFLVPNKTWRRQQNNKKYKIRLRNSGIPEDYYSISHEQYYVNVNDEKAVERKKELDKVLNIFNDRVGKNLSPKVNLYLYGLNNTQKTTVACNILKVALRKGLKGKFILAGELIDTLMKVQGFSRDIELEMYLKEIESCDIICIDDAFDPDKSLLWKNSDNKNLIVSSWDIFLRRVLPSKTHIVFTSNKDFDVIEKHFSKSLSELIKRNVKKLELKDNVMDYKKESLENIFK